MRIDFLDPADTEFVEDTGIDSGSKTYETTDRIVIDTDNDTGLG